MTTNGYDLAYPHTEHDPHGLVFGEHAGLTKREEFAKAAFKGLLSNSAIIDTYSEKALRNVAGKAVMAADLLIEALNG